MSRTYRRRGERQEYRWVLRGRRDAAPWWAHALPDRRPRARSCGPGIFADDAPARMQRVRRAHTSAAACWRLRRHA